MGIDAAKENFKPKYSFALGAAMPNPIIYAALNLISPVRIEKNLNQFRALKMANHSKEDMFLRQKN